MQVEFFGLPRERARVARLSVQAQTLGELWERLAQQIPSLGSLVAAQTHAPVVVANLNGDRFVSDPQTPLADTDCVLILSADAGG